MKLKKAASSESQANRQFRTIIFLFIGIVCLMGITGFTAFILTIEGREETMIPDVVDLPLEEAILAMQEKELNARIQLQFSSNPGDRGTVLAQEPKPGALVRAGSNMTLRVSKGAVVDRVENYVGWQLEDLRLHLQTIFTTHGQLISIKEPVITVNDEASPGTILEQKPLPGTEITTPVELDLVVSKGSSTEMVETVRYIGMDWQEALDTLQTVGAPFVFVIQTQGEDDASGVIVNQVPPAESERHYSDVVLLSMTAPDNVEEGQIFGILERTLPDYPVLVDITLESVNQEGDRSELVKMRSNGGRVGIPYAVPEGTILILSVFDEEIIRYAVRAQEE